MTWVSRGPFVTDRPNEVETGQERTDVIHILSDTPIVLLIQGMEPSGQEQYGQGNGQHEESIEIHLVHLHLSVMTTERLPALRNRERQMSPLFRKDR